MKNPDICLVSAFPAEAWPFIDFYGLKEICRKPFSIFHKDETWLIQSGLGKKQARDAVLFLFEQTGKNKDRSIWINAGAAGHASRRIGDGILAHKVIDFETSKSWYPGLVADFKIKTEPVCTVDHPEETYAADFVYDMEASGFYEAASQVSTLELIQCYKIISDNQDRPIQDFSSKAAQKLIEMHVHNIDRVIQTLRQMASNLPELNVESLDLFLERWHFTVTEQHQLKKLLLRLKTLSYEVQPEGLHASSAKDVLAFLQERLNVQPVKL